MFSVRRFTYTGVAGTNPPIFDIDLEGGSEGC